MSKRHSYLPSNLPSGCTVYAPLTEGNLAIGGVQPTITGNGEVTWDASAEAYKFSMVNAASSTCVLYWDIDLGLESNAMQEVTIFCKAFVAGATNGFPYLVVLGDANETSSYRPHINASNAFISQYSAWQNCAWVRRNTNVLTYYTSGRTDSVNASHVSNPANWNGSNKCNSRLCIFWRRNNEGINNPSLYAYIKDIMIFNRALTAQEIAAL